MPTADNSYSTRYKFVVARTNKTYMNSLTSSNIYIAGAIGQDPFFPIHNLFGNATRQPATNPRIIEPSCACVDTSNTTTTTSVCLLPQAFTINYISDDGVVYNYSWTPSANATSYTFGALNADGTAEQTSANTVTFTISSSSSENLQFQIVALNDCGSNAQVNSQGSPPCFLAGALITYADGSTKPIEEVKVGDMLLGAFGEVNEVLALHRPLLGDSLVYKLNGEHDTSDHHPHISVDKKFYANNLDTLNNKTYGTYQPVILADGSVVSWHLQGLKKDRTQEMVLGILLQTTYGGRKLDTLESYSLPPDTQMYNLAMSGSHTYFVNGYAVTGWPREDDFDYDTWTSK